MPELRYYPKPAILSELQPKPTNPRQLNFGFEGKPAVVIEASAGTGKTYTLEHLIADLVLTGAAKLPEILTLTYTEKAASQLRQKLRARLLDIAEGSTLSPPPGPHWVLDGTAMRRLQEAWLSFDQASISTIHSFCQRILTETAFENGRRFHESLVGSARAFDRAFDHALRYELATDPKHRERLKLWLQQYSLDHLKEALFDLHSKGGTPSPDLEEAELHAALQGLLACNLDPGLLDGVKKIHGGTKKALAARLRLLQSLKGQPDEACLIALEAKAQKKDEGLLGFLHERLAKLELGPELAAIRDQAGALGGRLPSLKAWVLSRFLPVLEARLESQKAALGERDFDDMLRLLEAAIARSPRLRELLRRRFPYALIDEFQDTDPTQWQIFSRLYASGDRAEQLVLIGDPKQAIYAFRGADVDTYLDAAQLILDKGGQKCWLRHNYRSSPAMLEAVNRILDQGADPPFFKASIRYDQPSIATERPVQLLCGGLPEAPLALLRCSKAEGLTGLADAIAKDIAAVLAPGSPLAIAHGEDQKPLRPDEIFVLAPTNKDAAVIEAALVEHGIPTQRARPSGLFQSQEARDLYWTLAAIAEPSSVALRLQAWKTLFFGVPWTELSAMAELWPDHPRVERLHQLKALAETGREGALWVQLFRESGVFERILAFPDAAERESRLLQLEAALQIEARKAHRSLPELRDLLLLAIEGQIDSLGEEDGSQNLSHKAEGVEIMTLHRAKGLEAKLVYLFGGFSGEQRKGGIHHEAKLRKNWIGPGEKPEVQAERRQELERLYYVGITRAQLRLVLPLAIEADGQSWLPDNCRYHALNTRLIALQDAFPQLESGRSAPDAEAQPEARPEAEVPITGLPEAAISLIRELQPFQPSAELMRLRETRRGPVLSSYSRIRDAIKAASPSQSPFESPQTPRFSPQDALELGGGHVSGSFLHRLLEWLPEAPAPEMGEDEASWATRPEVAALIAREAERFGIAPAFWPHSASMLFRTFWAPIQLGSTTLARGLGGAERCLPELDFHYPIEPKSGPQAGQLRGLMRGSIDLLLRDQGLSFVIDYKSDRLPNTEVAALSAHVEAHYRLQAEVYAEAARRILAIQNPADYEARFGGIAYVFTRYRAASPESGVAFFRPSFAAMEAASEAIARGQLAEWGQAS